ncbi:MAG: hypothetical protein IT314_10155 [Anaerolineales bacterium]|nr:hypothetical protein [Anaerolineales bacterium]
MKRATPFILVTLLLASCNGWIIQPLPGNAPTPFLPFTQAPSIFTATPAVLIATASPTPSVNTLTPSVTPFANATATSTVITPTSSATNTPPTLTTAGIALVVIGCKTSVDILHGMGEVTDAYVTLKNTGGMELTNVKVTLLALDPGQQTHPDQTAQIALLPIGYQVSLKLTADTTYKKATPIQVEVTSDQGLFPREGAASCTEIGLFAPPPSGLKTPVPITP